MLRTSLAFLVLVSCGDDATDAPSADASVARSPDAVVPESATEFVSGAAPACQPSGAPVAPSAGCLAEAATAAWGTCTLPAGVNAVVDGVATPLPAALVGDPVSCGVLLFVTTTCGPAVVEFGLGAFERSWAGFTAMGRECWMTDFGRVCAAVLGSGEHTLRIESCSAGFYTCTGVSDVGVSLSDSDVVVGSADTTSGCFPGGGCGCW